MSWNQLGLSHVLKTNVDLFLRKFSHNLDTFWLKRDNTVHKLAQTSSNINWRLIYFWEKLRKGSNSQNFLKIFKVLQQILNLIQNLSTTSPQECMKYNYCPLLLLNRKKYTNYHNISRTHILQVHGSGTISLCCPNTSQSYELQLKIR